MRQFVVRRRTRRAAPLLLAWTLLAPAGLAEEAAAPALPTALTEEVLVRARAPRAEDAQFATLVPADDLARRGADLADLLRRVPGVRVVSYGGIGRFATVSLRGSTAEQVTVLVDGVPQNRALGGPVDLSSIPASQIAEVAVYRGFAPATLGLEGLGGAIDVRTRRPSGAADGGSVDAVYGSLDTGRLAAGWSTPFGGAGGGLRLGVEGFRTDGDFTYLDTGGTIFDPDDDRETARRNNDSRALALQLQGSARGVLGGELSFGLRTRQSDEGVPGPDPLPSDSARFERRARRASLGWVRGEWELFADGVADRELFDDPEGDLGRRQRQQTRIDGGGIGAAWRAGAGAHRLLLRGTMRFERARVEDEALERSDRGGAERGTVALVAEDAIGLGRLTLVPAIRWEVRRDEAIEGQGALVPPATSGREQWLDGKLAVALALGASDALRASVGRFSRDPSLLELFGNQGAVVGNPRLTPETGLKADLGYALGEREWDGWRLGGEIASFYSTYDDMILMWPNPQGVVIPRNVASARVYGLEGSVALRLPGQLVLEASGTLLRSEDTSGGFADGNPLPGRPEMEGFAGARWSPGRWQLGWEVTYVGENSTDPLDLAAYRIPARTLHDARVAYAVGGGLLLGVEARNLFDVETRDVLRFPLPGRMIFASLSWAPEERR